ncbi:alpha/beta hydrolase [Metabacillus herbersteinensis]|uniref:Alpha/beta hydrolase n=1 Tax=Metabacillus herbersteinensis TaxID=283816 RepID=A0ABV6GL66_9BACI
MIGCLCIHGFTGAPYEVEPLAEHLRKLTGWEVRTPTLPGHGEDLSLSGLTYQEWINHAEEELKELLKEVDEVYVIGFSMGGLIATYLSVKYPVKKLVLLSAAVYYVNPKQLFLDVGTMIKDSIKGNIKENELFLRYKKKIGDTPIRATLEFRKLVKIVRPYLREVGIPVLIIQGECDGIVPVKSAHFLYETVSSEQKELCFLPSSKHQVCYGEDFKELTKRVEQFLIG